MTYIVSGGALNSTNSTHEICKTVTYETPTKLLTSIIKENKYNTN